MTDGHPHLRCIGYADVECGKAIDPKRDYQITKGVYQCWDCYERYTAWKARGLPWDYRASEDE